MFRITSCVQENISKNHLCTEIASVELTYDGVLLANLHLGRTHIANLDLAMCSIDEDVVAFDIAMNNWRIV